MNKTPFKKGSIRVAANTRHFHTVEREDDRKQIPRKFKTEELAILRFPDNLLRHIAPGKMHNAAIRAECIILKLIRKVDVPYLNNPDVFFAAT